MRQSARLGILEVDKLTRWRSRRGNTFPTSIEIGAGLRDPNYDLVSAVNQPTYSMAALDKSRSTPTTSE